MDKTYITRLLQLYFTNEATHAEREALFAELEQYRNNEDWEEMVTVLLPQVEEKQYDPERYQSIIDAILDHKQTDYMTPVVPMYTKKTFRWIAAACLLFVVCGLWFVVERRSQVSGNKTQVATTHDVPAPTNTRAVITLADGSKVYLDSLGNGVIAQQNNVAVVKNNNGEIIYSPDHQITTSPTISYNTLFNPRGSKLISLTLSDGTRVWLNSESSLKYPTAFTSNTREVEITGEAYFEVKHNAKQPFKVHLPNGSVIEDIGTAFNVNAYPDEDAIKTTLVEGSVRVSSLTANSQQLTAPGKQAVQIPQTRVIRVQDNVDVDEVMAWKNGRFQFSNASIEDILKEVSRYYDAGIVYQDQIPGHFVADISRDVPVSKLLRILELTNRVHFKIEGKQITVMK